MCFSLGPFYGAIAVPSVTRCRCRRRRRRCCCGHRCASGVRQSRRATVATPGEWQCGVRPAAARSGEWARHFSKLLLVKYSILTYLLDAVFDTQQLKALGRTLIVGRRTNALLGNGSLPYLPDNVAKTARRRGRLFLTGAEDYFFVAFNDFPWHRVLDVVVGRPAYDNYLVGLAIAQNVTVVDASATLLALHQVANRRIHVYTRGLRAA